MKDIIELAEERGEFVKLEDGYVYWYPKGGAISSYRLRAMADELDRRNADWDKTVEQMWREIKDDE